MKSQHIRRRVGCGYHPHQAGGARKLHPVVDQLDPVAGHKAMHVIAGHFGHGDLGGAVDAAHAGANRGIGARPFQQDPAVSGNAMGFHPVGAVLGGAQLLARRNFARVVRVSDRHQQTGQPDGRGGDDRGPIGNCIIRRGTGHVIRNPQRAHLPDGLTAARRINAHCRFDQTGVFQMVHLAPPDIQIGDDITIRRVGLHGIRQIRLLTKRHRGHGPQLGMSGVKADRTTLRGSQPMVFGQKSIDIHPAHTDQQPAAAQRDLKAFGQPRRITRLPDKIHRLDPPAPVPRLGGFVLLGIERELALRDQQVAVIVTRIESFA